jgi:hypothetical protein
MPPSSQIQDQPLTLQAAARQPDITLTELILRKETRPNQCFLIVEGPDEVGVLQPHCAANCSIYPQDGKDNVVRLIQQANNQRVYKRHPIEGVIGLVDRDFEHLQPSVARPARLAWTTPRFNDIESASLYHSGTVVLEGFASNDALQFDEWLALRDGNAFDLLVERIVAPIGAMRAAYQEVYPSASLEPKGDVPLIDRAWERVTPTKSLDLYALLDYLPQALPSGDRGKIQVRLRAMLRKIELDPQLAWDYVRGKDLVRTIAVALSKSPANLYNRLKVTDLARRLHQRVLDSLDASTLRECGTFDSITKASAADTGRYEYLKAI